MSYVKTSVQRRVDESLCSHPVEAEALTYPLFLDWVGASPRSHLVEIVASTREKN